MKNLNTKKSARLFAEAKQYMPGGVNSPVRAFKSVKRDPIFISKANGQYIYDADGNKFIDYVGSWGPMVLGHAHPQVVAAIKKAAVNGTSFGAPTSYEVEMAKLIRKMMPSIEVVRMVNSGTEATMSAVRVARAFTNREKIVKFAGCYHGHFDSFLIKAGSGATTFGMPDSPGVPKGLAALTLVAEFNDITYVEKLFGSNKDEIAAIIVEPVVGNMGVVKPEVDFLQKLLDLAHANSALLILDEVMTGFRLAPGGAQEIYKIKPDLTTFGKIIGAGLPVGAFGGREEIMRMVSPDGPVYQAGTLSGNPLAMAAGIVQLKILDKQRGIYKQLERMGKLLEEGIKDNLRQLGLDYGLNRAGSMFTLFFTNENVLDFRSALTCDTEKFATYFGEMLKRGIYLPPSQFEAAFISAAHTKRDIERTITANYESLKVVSLMRNEKSGV